ncbi:hypothetical protein GCM10010431_38020 [Streptomyces kunmingensis]|uniref:hypothetical protein n=1 Tax=Streptomyces kunmingensis TaxID=68225 RepID=UPI002D76E29B|nr:hypothetical protein [Streptomyces kunmingensis]
MPFADELIGREAVQSLTRAIRAAAPDADLAELRAAPRRIDPLPLRERADLLRDALLTDLPGDYAALARTVRIARDDTPHLTGWTIWPVTSAVATRAVREGGTAAFDDAMALLASLTGRLTAEFALRTLLRHDLDRALGVIAGDWTRSPDPDVRRLASEGTRPYLPWAVRVPGIQARPGATVPILDALYRDESEYVRRSVANHLNDLSRDHPDLVVATARRWLERPAATTERLVRHGLRTLIKRGHRGALELLGFAPAVLEVEGPLLDRESVPIGGSVRLTASIRNTGDRPARLAIDYIVHHRKADGGRTGKTFKLTTRTLAPGRAVRGGAGALVPAHHDAPLLPRPARDLLADQRSRVRAGRLRPAGRGSGLSSRGSDMARGRGGAGPRRAAAPSRRAGAYGAAEPHRRRGQETAEHRQQKERHPHLPAPWIQPSRPRGGGRPQEGASRVEDADTAQSVHRRRTPGKLCGSCHAGPCTRNSSAHRSNRSNRSTEAPKQSKQSKQPMSAAGSRQRPAQAG